MKGIHIFSSMVLKVLLIKHRKKCTFSRSSNTEQILISRKINDTAREKFAIIKSDVSCGESFIQYELCEQIKRGSMTWY